MKNRKTYHTINEREVIETDRMKEQVLSRPL